MSTDDERFGMSDDHDREERRARIRAWLAKLPAEVARVYEGAEAARPEGEAEGEVRWRSW